MKMQRNLYPLERRVLATRDMREEFRQKIMSDWPRELYWVDSPAGDNPLLVIDDPYKARADEIGGAILAWLREAGYARTRPIAMHTGNKHTQFCKHFFYGSVEDHCQAHYDHLKDRGRDVSKFQKEFGYWYIELHNVGKDLRKANEIAAALEGVVPW